jgi:hypothetical protein
MNIDGKEINWLSDEDYAKAIWQFRSQVGGILKPLEKYGQKPMVDGALISITKLAEDFGLRVRGIDHPIDLEIVKQQVQVRDE